MSPWLQHHEDKHQQSESLGLAVEGAVKGVQQQLQLEAEDNNNVECEFLDKDQTSPMTQMHQPKDWLITPSLWN